MKSERIRIYVNDHLAMLVGEIDLADRCKSNNRGGDFAEFLVRLIEDLEEQQMSLRSILQIGGGIENVLKQGMAWLTEKAGRFKLNDSLFSYSDLSRVVEIEALLVGATARIALWRGMALALGSDSAFREIPISKYREQSQEHLTRLHHFHENALKSTFA